jgi:DNA-binding Xre family transcriptional regulator
MSRSAYWRIEKGSNFEMRTLLRICKLLGISVQEFFNFNAKEKSEDNSNL